MSVLATDIRRTWSLNQGALLKRILLTARAPGVHAVIVFRFGQKINSCPFIFKLFLEPLYQIGNLILQIFWGIELPRAAKIGPGLYIGHFGGITVSSSAVIGCNCNLSQNVTIGVSGHGEKRGVPIIGDNVYIAPGARIFGSIKIGNNVKIGANAVVNLDVPDNSICLMHPGCRIIFK